MGRPVVASDKAAAGDKVAGPLAIRRPGAASDKVAGH